jgi:dTDP-glucose 4,6-dehydratase
MKILVTGGAGFIGANFVYYMLKKHPGYKIVAYDLLTYAGNLETLQDALKNPDFKFIRGDIADRQAVDDMFAQEKFDIVVNFAAESHVDRSIENPEIFLVTNVLGTQVLLDAASFGGPGGTDQVAAILQALNVPVRRVACGEDLSGILSSEQPVSGLISRNPSANGKREEIG